MQKITIKITGMTCGHCSAAVARALERVPGVKSAEVSLEQAQATVSGTADPRTLVAAVKEEGYGAELQP